MKMKWKTDESEKSAAEIKPLTVSCAIIPTVVTRFSPRFDRNIFVHIKRKLPGRNISLHHVFFFFFLISHSCQLFPFILGWLLMFNSSSALSNVHQIQTWHEFQLRQVSLLNIQKRRNWKERAIIRTILQLSSLQAESIG